MKPARIVFAAAVVACSSSTASAPVDPYPSCANGKFVLDDPSVITDGFDANACREFMKAIPSIQTDAAKAPTLITPLAGAVLPATPVAKFTWTKGQLAQADAPSFWRRLGQELVLERTAQAADDGGADGGGGLTSDAYVVIFRSVDGTKEILRVMTTQLETTPSDTAWAALQSTGTLEASVYGMHFEAGKITAGPFTTSQPRTFSISP